MTIPIGVLHFQCKTPCPQHTLLHSLEGFMHGVIGHRLNIGIPSLTRVSNWILLVTTLAQTGQNVHLRLASCLAIWLHRLLLLKTVAYGSWWLSGCIASSLSINLMSIIPATNLLFHWLDEWSSTATLESWSCWSNVDDFNSLIAVTSS